MRSGYVALIGRPNSGKSTLLNRLVGEKVSIVSRHPHTTRHRIRGIKTTERGQIVYVDTPGLHGREPRALNKLLNRTASTTLLDVDLVVWVDDRLGWGEDHERILRRLSDIQTPVILALNKIDRQRDKQTLLPVLADRAKRNSFTEIVPISARDGVNTERLETLILDLLPEGDPIYPEDIYSDQPVRFHAAEIVREKLFGVLGDELPYQLTVEIEQFLETEARAEIHALIWLERNSQKAIVIGHGGNVLKGVGQAARADLEAMLDKAVSLHLWVKVKEAWSDDERLLQRFGYTE